jgi:hypothetical protein
LQRSNPLLNFAGGLLTKKLFGRVDLSSYPLGKSISRNFIGEVQGPDTYRPGSRYVIPTRLNGLAYYIPFVFNDAQAYDLAFSDKKFRIFSKGGVITEDPKTITGIVIATGVITSATHGYSTGDQILIYGITGTTELNEKYFLVVKIDANTYTLKDLDGNAIDMTGYTAYTIGGKTERVYEVTTPYDVEDIPKLKFAQKADIMYIAHPYYEPRKLIRLGETNWTLSTFTRTSDPFTFAITAPVTQAAACSVHAVAHGLITGDLIEIYGVVGMTQLNGNTYSVVRIDADNVTLKDPVTLVDINSTGYTAYSSGGYLFKQGNMPGAVAFYGGRLFYGGTDDDPETFFGSMAPDDDGASRFDNFTVGADPEDAIIFPIASQNNTADRIFWFAGTSKFLAIGTYGGVYKAYGATEAAPISGTEINVQAVDFYGVQDMLPIRVGTNIFYVQRGGLILNRFAYSILDDGYTSEDLNVLSDEVSYPGITQLALQQGKVNILWLIRSDGVLLGISTKEQEKIAAWHTHYLGGNDVKVRSVGGEPSNNNSDSLWLVVERTIGNVTRRYHEYFSPDEVLPEFEDFYTGNEVSDRDAFEKRQYEVSKQFVRVDSALSLDTSQNQTLTPAAVTGASIVFTAGGALFTAADVGRRIVKKYVTGFESGVAEIIGYTSPTQVTCKILENFDTVNTIPVLEWFLTVTEISGLEHLEGETVKVVTDGAVHPSQTVTDGAITLDTSSTVVHVGPGYRGWLRTMPLESRSVSGSSMAMTSTVNRVGVLFRHTLGTRFGTDPYRMEQVITRTTNDRTGQPPPLFTGMIEVRVPDGYSLQKFIDVIQDEPLPCTVQAIIPFTDVTEE